MSSGCNPYLAFSAYVLAGMDGVKNEMDPGAANFENTYALGLEEISRRGIRVLPQSLPEALTELKNDQVVQEALGPHLRRVYEGERGGVGRLSPAGESVGGGPVPHHVLEAPVYLVLLRSKAITLEFSNPRHMSPRLIVIAPCPSF